MDLIPLHHPNRHLPVAIILNTARRRVGLALIALIRTNVGLFMSPVLRFP
jgi:hypothetical protein